MADTKDLSLVQGKTFALVLRWETEPVIYRAITAIQQTAPVRLTVTAHGAPDGWRCAVSNAKGMTEINAEANALRKLVEQSGAVFALSHNYTGYPMVKQARHMVASGALGKIQGLPLRPACWTQPSKA